MVTLNIILNSSAAGTEHRQGTDQGMMVHWGQVTQHML